MSHDQPAEPVAAGTDGRSQPAVVEWGDDRPTGRFGRRLGTLGRRVHPAHLVAAVGGAVLFASLLSDWRTWTVDQSPNSDIEREMTQQIATGVTSFPSIGTGYVIGLLVLAGCTALAFAGTRPVRRNARLVGLATTVTMLALLVTASANLDQLGGVIEDIALPHSTLSEGMQSHIEYGQGLYLAYGGVVAMAVALLMAVPSAPRQQTAPAQPDRPGITIPSGTSPGGSAAGDDRDGDEDDGWLWHPGRDRRTGVTAAPPDEPEGLTVEPVAPFLPPGDPDGRR